MDKHPLFSIQGPSTGAIEGPHIHDIGSNLLLTLTLDDDGRIRKSQHPPAEAGGLRLPREG
jgi:hypothetical protein